jgi:hypothetical protein
MRATLGVPEVMAQSLGAFVRAEGIPLDIVAGGDCTVQVVQSQQGQPSTRTVLHAGGSIECTTAFQMAGKLGVKPRDIGKLANHLDVRIRACQLGCFE